MQPDNLTVTARGARTAVPGRLDDLTEWAHGFTGRAQSFPGYRESKVRVSERHRRQVVVEITFASPHDLIRWEDSKERQAHLQQAVPLTIGQARPLTPDALTGAIPTAGPARPRWWTAILVWIALVPPAMFNAYFIAPLLTGLPPYLQILCTTPLTVACVIWVMLPLLHALEESIRHWLAWRRGR